jgi:hypothetical protein
LLYPPRKYSLLSDAPQIETLQRRKQRTLVVFIATGIALLLACLLRMIPGLNDFLAGRPPYAKALTTLMAQEFSKVAQDRFPVIVLGEDEYSDAVAPAQIADDQIAGILYVLTYSERQHFSCITTYAVPVDPSNFSNLQTLQPEAEWTAGPRIVRPMNVLPVARDLHVYAPAYLESLHWRVTPRFPISMNQASNLAGQHYESRNPVVPPDAHANINIDFDKARALVRQPHDKINFWLSRVITVLIFCALCFTLSFIEPYRKLSRQLRSYGDRLDVFDFLTQDMNQRASAARTKFHEKERERQEQELKAATEQALRQDLEEKLRYASANLQDEGLRQRIQQCLNQSPDLDVMELLWAEAQKAAGHRTPEEKLMLLLESLKPFCTEEELSACRIEATKILAELGFRTARNYAISMHDQFKMRMRQIETPEGNTDTAETAK